MCIRSEWDYVLAGLLRRLERPSIHQKVAGSIPGPGACGRPPIDASLSHWYFSLPLPPLSKSANISLDGEWKPKSEWDYRDGPSPNPNSSIPFNSAVNIIPKFVILSFPPSLPSFLLSFFPAFLPSFPPSFLPFTFLKISTEASLLTIRIKVHTHMLLTLFKKWHIIFLSEAPIGPSQNTTPLLPLLQR